MTTLSPFLRVFDLERLDGDLFAAPVGGSTRDRLFGGQIAAQALRAAGLTVGDRPVHSLHSYFIRPATTAEPLQLEVYRLRDGRAFSTRSVTATQRGKPVFEMIASFQDPEAGEDWQVPGPSLPLPDDPAPDLEPRRFGGYSPVEICRAAPRRADAVGFPFQHPFWVRINTAVGEEQALHACLLTYLSDLGVVDTARSPASSPDQHGMRLSLDHSIWFHRPSRADQWHLYTMESVAHIGTRGLAHGSLLTADGTLVASVAQEVLLRK